MYKNFANSDQTEFNTDVCIIGAGANGFACALNLMKSGLSVLILEGGLQVYNDKAADLHKSQVVGQPHIGIHEARERIVGGTTTKWGGQALPFMKEDFEKRDHINLSGWPISFDDLKPFYKKAELILGTDSLVPYNYNPWKSRKINQPFTNNKLELIVTKWCKVPNFAIQHGAKIAQSLDVTLLYNANAIDLIPNYLMSAISALKIKSLDGKEGLVNAKYFIAAGGTLETVRLFLNATKFGKKGLGNKNGLVGHYFQDHAAAVVGRVIPKSLTKFQNIFDPFYLRGFKYFPRVKLNAVFANKAELLHSSAQFIYTGAIHDPLSIAKAFINSVRKRENVSYSEFKYLLTPKRIIQVLKAALRWKILNRGTSAKNGNIWLEIHSEQEPDFDSEIKLALTKDSLGMRRIKLHWNISKLTLKTIKETAKIIQEEFDNSGVGKIVLEPWVLDQKCNNSIYVMDTFHQCGGLRMANTDKKGVVDSDCKVFNIDNLYVSNAAVFPTSSFSNPTMTSIALSIRLSEKILSEIKLNQTALQYG